MKWFGPPWGGKICRLGQKVGTPTSNCFLCGEPIRHLDRGVILPFTNEEKVTEEHPWHLGCLHASLF